MSPTTSEQSSLRGNLTSPSLPAPAFDFARAVIGNRQARSVFERALASGRLSHAYLLVGPPRVGKATVALALARAANCVGSTRPCGVCRPCRLALAGAHPDIHLVQSGDESAAIGKRSASDRAAAHRIGIEQVRALQHDATLAPVEGQRKAYIISDAPMLSLDAANSLLKTLEEPPPHVLLVLTATDVDSLLPTIVSRCQTVRLSPVGRRELASALAAERGAAPERADLLARLAGGCPGWAIAALEDSSVLEERSRRLDDLAALLRGNRAERLSFTEKLAQEYSRDPDRIVRTLGLWLGYWRDVRLASLGLDDLIVNCDRIEEIRGRGRAVGSDEIGRACAGIDEALAHLGQNVNARLALDVMALGLPAA